MICLANIEDKMATPADTKRVLDYFIACQDSRRMLRAATQCRNLILKFFESEPEKALLWWAAPNPMLGGIVPLEMIKIGRADKLLKFIKGQLEENEPPEKVTP